MCLAIGDDSIAELDGEQAAELAAALRAWLTDAAKLYRPDRRPDWSRRFTDPYVSACSHRIFSDNDLDITRHYAECPDLGRSEREAFALVVADMDRELDGEGRP